MTYTYCVCTCILSSLNVFVYDLGSVKCLSKCIPSGVGKRSNRWSAVTIRLALAVYCRSPAAYDALKSLDCFNYHLGQHFRLLLVPFWRIVVSINFFTHVYVHKCVCIYMYIHVTCSNAYKFCVYACL